MKLNWGHRLAIGMGIFMLFIVVLTVRMMRSKVDLVSENYYQDEIEYQQQITKQQRSQKLFTSVKFKKLDSFLYVTFPKEKAAKGISGTIHLFRASDARLDRKLPIQTDSAGVQRVDITTLVKGVWKVQADWACAGEAYFDQSALMISPQ